MNATKSASALRPSQFIETSESLPKRAYQAALEIPRGIGKGALSGLVVVALPSVLAPPIAPFFLPWLPVAAVVGSMHGAVNGLINAASVMAFGTQTRRI